MAGTAGFAKKGYRILYLGGDNSALSGTLNIDGFPGGINAGVVLTSDTAIGGITTVNINGNATYGGFFQLDGGLHPRRAGVTLEPEFDRRSNGVVPAWRHPQHRRAALSTRSKGPINVTLNESRISNNDANRLDITGAINGGCNDSRSSATPTTKASTYQHRQLLDRPDHHIRRHALVRARTPCPHLLCRLSRSGQTTGSTSRGSAAAPVSQWQNVTNGDRAGGFSARGGIAVNLGGAGRICSSTPSDRHRNTASIPPPIAGPVGGEVWPGMDVRLADRGRRQDRSS